MIYSIIYYGSASLVILGLMIYGIKNWQAVAALYFLATFDVTCFIKFGMTISYFESALLLLLIRSVFLKVRLIALDRKECLAIYFLALCVLSVIISQLRFIFNDLQSDASSIEMVARSIQSNGKLIFYVFILSILSRVYRISSIDFIKGVAIGAIPAAIAVILQYAGVGLILIHNNPSFGMGFNIQTYTGQRPAGLTNEASFYAYQVAFSIIMLLVCILRKYISTVIWMYIIMCLYFTSLIASIARSGWVIIPALCMIISWLEIKRSSRDVNIRKTLVFICVLILAISLLTKLEFQGFNVASRFLSSFNTEADASTIERYASLVALLGLALDKSLLFGVGIYNYAFYIKPYIAPEVWKSFYADNTVMPSFSFVIQLFAEFGGILFLLLFLGVYRYYRTSVGAEKYWFLVALLFAMTFQVTNFACTYFIFILRNELVASDANQVILINQ